MRAWLGIGAVVAALVAPAGALGAATTLDGLGGMLVVATSTPETITVACEGGQTHVNGEPAGIGCAALTNLTVYGSPGDDTIDLSGLGIADGFTNPELLDSSIVWKVHVESGDGDDDVTGSPLGDFLNTGDGADTVLGGGGEDNIDVGGGGGSVDGGDASDTIFFALNADNEVSGGAGEDWVVGEGTAADDTIVFTASQIVLNGDSQTTLIGVEHAGTYANAGADTLDASGATAGTYLDGGSGSDTVIGSPFADELYSGSDNGVDHYDGGQGSDSYTVYDDPDALTIADTGATGSDTLTVLGTPEADAYAVTSALITRASLSVAYTGIEGLVEVFGGWMDEIAADSFSVTSIGPGGVRLDGAAGDDVYAIAWGSLGGPVQVEGGAGSDSLAVSACPTAVTANTASRGPETVGFAGIETVPAVCAPAPAPAPAAPPAPVPASEPAPAAVPVAGERPGPPTIATGTGAAQPPLRAVRQQTGFSVSTVLTVDDEAMLKVSVFNPRTGTALPLLRGSSVGKTSSGKTRSSVIAHAGAGETVRLRLRVAGLVPGRVYRIVVTALDASGESSSVTLPFRR